jgi:hypothetical protein
MATVSAARATARYEFLAPERQTAVAAVAGFHGNGYFIDKHGEKTAPLRSRLCWISG